MKTDFRKVDIVFTVQIVESVYDSTALPAGVSYTFLLRRRETAEILYDII